ncbi:MAG: sigma-70 family RNA polymerase sigma factor [Flavobacteriales bacterium]|nr:sigma-70 family RNA polymerase sigma factor [Flavobacteriales bacterium]
MATILEKERLSPTWSGMEVAVDPISVELIDGCLTGDRRCQQRIYETFYGKMLAVCLRYTKNTDQAKDILQDGFIKVFRSMDRFNREGSFEGWVRRIMVNTAIDHFRRSKNSYLLLGEDQSIEDHGDPDVEEPFDDPTEEEEMDLRPADVINAMQKLTPAYRTVFNLYVFEEMTHKEIADELGISVGTSKSNLAKAKGNLRKILKQEHRLP